MRGAGDFFGALGVFYLLGKMLPLLSLRALSAASFAFAGIPAGALGIFFYNLANGALMVFLGRVPPRGLWVRALLLLNGGMLGLLQSRGLFFPGHMVPETAAILVTAEASSRRNFGLLPWAVLLFALGAWMEGPLWNP